MPYPVEVTKEVVRYQLRWWQKPLVWLGGLTLIGLAVWLPVRVAAFLMCLDDTFL